MFFDNSLLKLKSLSEPFWDLLDRGGKRWRPALGEFIAETFNKSFVKIMPKTKTKPNNYFYISMIFVM